ncbi:hypothetical protein [Sphingomonas faeni]|jgi:low affinity Fe/Cu permease|uniref:hypothetical protein n=1 Tax=Sphingomonas faeni TaxID=185950 RepID=UPI0020C7DD31|nr:hypothetical protein [Sphingomonas faeni]MCP8893025.1 hypothetical protein [Sphingomonas faeni]
MLAKIFTRRWSRNAQFAGQPLAFVVAASLIVVWLLRGRPLCCPFDFAASGLHADRSG